jgi:AmmeMemoRadiSam system protein A
LDQQERQTLLQIARAAIQNQLATGKEYTAQLEGLSANLTTPLASFVTINLNGKLRGCIGSLAAHRPLAQDVVYNAQSAAFRDPRFPPLKKTELKNIDIHISVLSQPEPLPVGSREELLQKIRPGIDGLIIQEEGRRATYLPSVWSQLPEPNQFISELRAKAGLNRNGWSDDTQVFRYTTEEFS